MKACTRCKLEKPVAEFHAKTRYPDGTVRTYQSRCKECMKELQRKYPPSRPKTHAERLYLKRRRYRARIARLHSLFLRVDELPDGRRLVRWQDRQCRRHQRIMPAKEVQSFVPALERERRADLAAWREEVRLKEKLRRDRKGARSYPPRKQWQDGRVIAGAYVPPTGKGAGDHVDPAPLLRFLDDLFPDWEPEEVAPLLTVDPRRLREWKAGEPANLHTVDVVLTRGLGRPEVLNDLYPVVAA